MKNTAILLLLLFLLKLPSSSQTPCWVEEFNSSQGWTLEENWSIANGTLQFNWYPDILHFDLSATSPVITLFENTKELIVSQFLNTYGASIPSEVAEISIIVSDESQILWSYEISNGNWGIASGTDLVLDISDFGGQDVQFQFRTYGPSTHQWEWWNIFRIQLTVLLENDLTLAQISGNTIMNPNETSIWDISVKNLGSNIQNGFNLKLMSLKYNESIADLIINDNINPQETKVYSFEWTPQFAFNTVLRAEVLLQGDEYPENNISKGHFVRIKPNIEFSVLLWDYDNGIETITDPEIGGAIQPSTGLERALEAAGIEYDFVNYLPNNLNNYDMIFSTMGCFCVD